MAGLEVVTSSRTRHGRVPRENMRVLREGVIRARPVLHVVNEPGLRRGLHREKAKKPLFYNAVGRCPGPPEPAVTSRSRGTPLPAPPSGSSLEDAPPGTRMRIYNPASLRSQRINTHRSRRGVATRGPAPLVRAPRRSRGRCDRSVSHHQDRAFGVAHHVSGVGAEEIGAHGVPMLAVRTHDDQIGLDGVRFFQDLLIDAALAHRR